MQNQKPQVTFGILEVARKKRQIYLLEKLQTKSLTRKEIEELEKLEHGVKKGKEIEKDPGIVKTQKEVAQAFGVSVRTVRNWVSEGMPKSPEGYDLLEIKVWKDDKKQKILPGFKKEVDEWDLKIRKYKAQRAEIELQKLLGEVISIEEVKKERIERILAIKRAFCALPKTVAPIIATMKEPREIQSYLTKQIEGVINQFAGDIDKSSAKG